jgi:hypothetical protein
MNAQTHPFKGSKPLKGFLPVKTALLVKNWLEICIIEKCL